MLYKGWFWDDGKAISTLGCSGESFGKVIALAYASVVAGLELRGVAGESVYSGMPIEPARDVVRTLNRVGLVVFALARELGVPLPLETHYSFPRGEDIGRILGNVDAGAPVQVIWDLMHPWRHDEAPGLTAQLLVGSLGYSQFKVGKGKPETNGVTLTLPGEGELALRSRRIVGTLRQ